MEELVPGFRKERVFEVENVRVGGEIIGTKLATSNEKRTFSGRYRETEPEVFCFGEYIEVDEERIGVFAGFQKSFDRRIGRQHEHASFGHGEFGSEELGGTESFVVVGRVGRSGTVELDSDVPSLASPRPYWAF